MDAEKALELITRSMGTTLKDTGFRTLKSETEDNGKYSSVFTMDDGALRIELFEDMATLYYSRTAAKEADEGDYKQLTRALLELETAEERDCKSVAEEFAEDILKKCRKQAAGGLAASSKKAPKSVSKSAIKNGDAYYDAVSFGNSFTGIYPELRGAFKENYEKYGEFLCDEFFQDYGNAAVLATVRENKKPAMQRLFNLFNDVYENGLNDVQSLVAVTILGALNNDEALLVGCVDYMSKDLAPVVIGVNRFLASGAGKAARQRLEHPPIYKPKKQKKQGLFQQMLGGGAQGI